MNGLCLGTSSKETGFVSSLKLRLLSPLSPQMKKHLNVLPSVVVVFADIDWTDPDTRAVVSTVARVRQLLTGRLTKVVVVLLQTDTSTPTDSVMTALCTVWSLIQGNLLQEGRRGGPKENPVHFLLWRRDRCLYISPRWRRDRHDAHICTPLEAARMKALYISSL